MSVRIEKVNQEIRKQLMKVIQQEVDDPGIGLLTIIRVKTSSDLEEAKIYFSLLDENNYQKAEKMLNKMGKFIRSRLAARIRLRKIPQLLFYPDDSIKHSLEIHQKIEDLKRKNDG